MSNEILVLEGSESLPHVPLAPAPWRITGNGYIVAVWMPRDVIDNAFLPPTLAASHRGRLALMMFVDYHEAPCGQYQELLYIPGPMQFNEHRHRSITRIFVSSYNSVVNGRRNWGIPMDRADFKVHYGDDGVDRVRVSRGDHVIAEMSFKGRGPSIHFDANRIPKFMRTLAQQWEGNEYIVTPEADGIVQWGSIRSTRFDPVLFPDINRGRVLGVVKARSFSLMYPQALVSPIRRR